MTIACLNTNRSLIAYGSEGDFGKVKTITVSLAVVDLLRTVIGLYVKYHNHQPGA